MLGPDEEETRGEPAGPQRRSLLDRRRLGFVRRTSDEGRKADVLTTVEAASFLRVSRNALYDAIGRGEVPHQRIGKNIRLSRAALVRWLGSWSSQVSMEE